MWRVIIHRYQFGRIENVGRWILSESDAPDVPIPIRLSDLSWAIGSRSDGREESERREAHLGFRCSPASRSSAQE
jgi:hypothetical protein